MPDIINGLNGYISSLNTGKVENPEEIELAFQLQNSSPNDPDLLERLVFTYAGDLWRWINGLLSFYSTTTPTNEAIFILLKETFANAIGHPEQFHGQASVSAWLFAISYRVVKRAQLRNWMNGDGGVEDSRSIPEDLPVEKKSAYWSSVTNLPEKLRTALLLRYLFGKENTEIASILSSPPEEAHLRLTKARQGFLAKPLKTHVDDQIQAALDGLLVHEPDEQEQLSLHLGECETCRSSAVKHIKIDQMLREKIKQRWGFPDLSTEDLRALVKTILWEVNQPKTWWKAKVSLTQVIWMAGLSLVFIGLAVVFIRITPIEREFPLEEIPTSTSLPPRIDIPRNNASPQNGIGRENAPWYIASSFSSDGKWAVITSIYGNGWGFFFPSTEIYNVETHTSEFISQGNNGIVGPWHWLNLAPSISGDGRWIAYVSGVDNSDTSKEPFESDLTTASLDILLYDRIEGTSRKITQAADGGAANGDSLAPTISDDGHWLAFWSAATNLIGGTDITCTQGETRLTCLNIYLYDLQKGKFILIPTNTIPGYPENGVDRISLSADGRYIGFTITPGSQLQTSLEVSPPSIEIMENPLSGIIYAPKSPAHRSEAIVFDRVSGKFEWINQASDGTPGDAESSSPVLSANGRYVAFIAASSNLGPVGSGKIHIYVRDRESGKVEIVNFNSGEGISEGDSGSTFWDREYYGIDISADGRYVLFESNEKNLVTNISPECSENESTACNILYLFDRQTQEMELITALTNQGIPHLPDISPDGRWVTYSQSFSSCSPFPAPCSDVMRFDRLQGWMNNLTKNNQDFSNIPLPYLGTIKLPWLSWESSALAFSPDGSMLAIGSIDSKVRIWLVPWKSYSGQQEDPFKILDLKTNEYLTVIRFTPDGEWLAAGTASGVVYIWNLTDGRLLYKLSEQEGSISSLVFSRDQSHMIISTIRGTWIWSIDTHQLVKVNELSYAEKPVYSVDVSSTGDLIATARDDGFVWLQRLPDGQGIGRLISSETARSKVAFSPDGELLAVSYSEGKIDLWQIKTTESGSPSITFLSSFYSSPYGGILVFSADNKYLASSRMMGELSLWDIPEERFYTFQVAIPNQMVYSLAFSSQGDKFAAVFEDQIVLWGMPSSTTSGFFAQSTHDSYIDAEPFPRATANDLPGLFNDANNVWGEHLDLDQVSLRLDFPLLVPAHLPENIRFHAADVYEDGSVLLTYDVSSQGEYDARLFIYENSIPYTGLPTMTIGANASFIPTLLWTEAGRTTGEYIRGDWVNTQTYTSAEEGSLSGVAHSVWQWNYASNSQRLRWQQGRILIGLYYQVGNVYTPILPEQSQNNELFPVNTLLEKSDLIQIANGMKLITEVIQESIH